MTFEDEWNITKRNALQPEFTADGQRLINPLTDLAGIEDNIYPYRDGDGPFEFCAVVGEQLVTHSPYWAEIWRAFYEAIMADPDNIPFDGRPVMYETEDNLSLPELGLMEV